jgi:hypothetical protein
MSKIEFEVRDKDLIKFTTYNYRQHPKVQKMFSRNQFLYPFILGLVVIYMYALLGNTTYALPLALVTICWAIFIPMYLQYNLKSQAEALYSEEEKLNLLGPHTFKAEDKHLHGVFPGNETRIRWKDIARAELQKGYLYLYLDTDRALIIPKETVSSGDFNEFLNAVEKHLQAAS